MCSLCMAQRPPRSEEGISTPLGLSHSGCGLSYTCWESDLGPLEERLSSQPPCYLFCDFCFSWVLFVFKLTPRGYRDISCIGHEASFLVTSIQIKVCGPECQTACRRDGSVVKSAGCSSREPRFSSQQPHGSSQPSGTAVPGDLVPPSSLWVHRLTCKQGTRQGGSTPCDSKLVTWNKRYYFITSVVVRL